MNEDFERRYRSLLEQYTKLLQEWLENSHGEERPFPLLPPFHPIAVLRDECPLRGQPDLASLLVGPGSRAAGLRELRDFTRGVERLTILDPYLFSGDAAHARKIAHDFAQTARTAEGTLKAVHVIRDDRRDTKAVFAAISRTLRQDGVRLSHGSSQDLHDRVWIGDGQRGVVVGTSLNGLGSRAAFILPLPKADLDAILEFLYERRLAHRPRHRGRQ